MIPPYQSGPKRRQGGCSRTLDAPTPWVVPPCTAFAESFPEWAWVTSTLVFGPVSLVEWAFSPLLAWAKMKIESFFYISFHFWPNLVCFHDCPCKTNNSPKPMEIVSPKSYF
jgi:hypothetical protein